MRAIDEARVKIIVEFRYTEITYLKQEIYWRNKD